jgi:hypothetical protein
VTVGAEGLRIRLKGATLERNAATTVIMHMSGAHYGEIAKSAGGLFFVWTLWALGRLGGRHRHALGAPTAGFATGPAEVVLLFPRHAA